MFWKNIIKIKIAPSFYHGKLNDWLQYQEPWCLSRHLDWGHRIPAYTVDGNAWIIAESIEDAARQLQTKDIIQDNNVLDTWFR